MGSQESDTTERLNTAQLIQNNLPISRSLTPFMKRVVFTASREQDAISLEPSLSQLHLSLENLFGKKKIWPIFLCCNQLHEMSLPSYISDIVKMKTEFQKRLYSCRPYENEVKLINFLS